MAKIDVKITDHKQEVLEAMHEQVQAALEAIGMDAASTAAQDGVCPVDTGTLKNSIGHAVDGNTVYIGTNVEYAPYQELGTSRGIVGKHFLQFGVSAHSAEYADIIKRYLQG